MSGYQQSLSFGLESICNLDSCSSSWVNLHRVASWDFQHVIPTLSLLSMETAGTIVQRMTSRERTRRLVSMRFLSHHCFSKKNRSSFHQVSERVFLGMNFKRWVDTFRYFSDVSDDLVGSYVTMFAISLSY